MNSKKSNIIYYTLSIISFLLLVGYLILSFIPIFSINGEKVNIYQAVQGFNGLKSNAYMHIALICELTGIILVIIWPILALFQVKKNVLIVFSCLSLPLLAFALISNLFITPIYKSINGSISDSINPILLPLILQNVLLILAILINISLITYVAISQYKHKSYIRGKL